jgi:hypothetical protein
MELSKMVGDSLFQEEWWQLHPIVLYITTEFVIFPQLQAVFPDRFPDLSRTGYDPHKKIDGIGLIWDYPSR